MSLVALDGIAVLIQENSRSETPSQDITIADNDIHALVHAIKIISAEQSAISGIKICNNLISMVDRIEGREAIYSVADDVLIRGNQIVVVPQNNPNFRSLLERPDNPIHAIYNICADSRTSYELGFPLKSIVSMMRKYVIEINRIYLNNDYQALGGIKIGGSSEDIRIMENIIVGGSGNGITLGHLPEYVFEPMKPVAVKGNSEQKRRKSYAYKTTVISKTIYG